MAHTALSNIVVPEVWAPEILRESEYRSAIIQSGAIAADPRITEQLDAGGKFINLPYMNPLTGDSEVISTTGTATVNNQTGDSCIAPRLMRIKGWGWSDVIAWVQQGQNPVDSAIQNIGIWWAYDMQTTLISILKGIMATALASTHVHDATAGTITGTAISQGAEKLGDARADLTMIMAHSHVVADLEQNDQIQYLRDADATVMYKQYQGKYLVVEDDRCPVTSGTPDTYHSYLIGAGALAYGVANIAADEAVETERNAAGSASNLWVRRNYIQNPQGMNYAGSTADAQPTNTTLETGASWAKKYPDKLIKIVRLDTQ